MSNLKGLIDFDHSPEGCINMRIIMTGQDQHICLTALECIDISHLCLYIIHIINWQGCFRWISFFNTLVDFKNKPFKIVPPHVIAVNILNSRAFEITKHIRKMLLQHQKCSGNVAALWCIVEYSMLGDIFV